MEHHGKEAPLSHAYKDYVTELSAKDIKYDLPYIRPTHLHLMMCRYCEYDFHAETKGMKYVCNLPPIFALMYSIQDTRTLQD